MVCFPKTRKKHIVQVVINYIHSKMKIGYQWIIGSWPFSTVLSSTHIDTICWSQYDSPNGSSPSPALRTKLRRKATAASSRVHSAAVTYYKIPSLRDDKNNWSWCSSVVNPKPQRWWPCSPLSYLRYLCQKDWQCQHRDHLVSQAIPPPIPAINSDTHHTRKFIKSLFQSVYPRTILWNQMFKNKSTKMWIGDLRGKCSRLRVRLWPFKVH